jgi:hypothetical protein
MRPCQQEVHHHPHWQVSVVGKQSWHKLWQSLEDKHMST